MSDYFLALLWIDHREAKVFRFNATDVDRTTIHSQHPARSFFKADDRMHHQSHR
jgi:hypothetical protein